MAIDDATIDSQQRRKERRCRHNNKTNVNDTRETLVQPKLKNVHDACETLEAAKAALEKATLVVAMESKVNKVNKAITTIQSKIEVVIFC